MLCNDQVSCCLPDSLAKAGLMTSAQSAAQPEPTAAEVAEAVVNLLAEVDAALSSDRWAFLDTGSDEVKYRLYDAAALRHCCLLLEQIAQCAAADQDLAVHILGRAHLEAWLFAMYLHFGRQDALTRIAQDTRKGLEAADHENKEFNDRLAKAKKQAEQKLAKVIETNVKISQWNENHPDKPPKPLVEEPHVPALMPTYLDLSDRIAELWRPPGQGSSRLRSGWQTYQARCGTGICQRGIHAALPDISDAVIRSNAPDP